MENKPKGKIKQGKTDEDDGNNNKMLYASTERIHTCSVYHNLFNYRPFARLNMYQFNVSFFLFLRQYFAFHLFSWISLVACLMYSIVVVVLFSFFFPFLRVPLILLLISWVQIDSKKQPNRNRCCLNNSMRFIHAFMYTTFALCLSLSLSHGHCVMPNLVRLLLLGNNMYQKLPDK